MIIENRDAIFFISVLYGLDEKWRGIGTSDSFERLLDPASKPNLHQLFNQLHNKGLFGSHDRYWYFSDRGSFLDNIVVEGVNRLLIRLDGDIFNYHLDDASPEVLKCLMTATSVDPALVESVSKELNQMLASASSPAPAS